MAPLFLAHPVEGRASRSEIMPASEHRRTHVRTDGQCSRPSLYDARRQINRTMIVFLYSDRQTYVHLTTPPPWSGTLCRTTSSHSRTTSPLDRVWKPGFSPDTSVFSALKTFVIIALYKSTFTIPYHRPHRGRRNKLLVDHTVAIGGSSPSCCEAPSLLFRVRTEGLTPDA